MIIWERIDRQESVSDCVALCGSLVLPLSANAPEYFGGTNRCHQDKIGRD